MIGRFIFLFCREERSRLCTGKAGEVSVSFRVGGIKAGERWSKTRNAHAFPRQRGYRVGQGWTKGGHRQRKPAQYPGNGGKGWVKGGQQNSQKQKNIAQISGNAFFIEPGPSRLTWLFLSQLFARVRSSTLQFRQWRLPPL